MRTYMILILVILHGCSGKDKESIEPRVFTDSLYAVITADRVNYTKVVVHRLAQSGNGILAAKEHWEEHNNGIPLPAQMFRMGAELVADKQDQFSYSLLSLWAINQKNKPITAGEKEGLKYVANKVGENYYTIEKLGKKKYYTAVYPDIAVSEACTQCHNNHRDSPRNDFKIGDIMGGIVIRVAIKD